MCRTKVGRMNKFIAFDNETGGIAPETSLLTVYFAILDDKLNLVDELDLKLKPNDGKPYLVEAGGLAVNKINLIEHDKTAITYSEGGQLLVKLLKKHAVGKDRLTPLGHNVTFDIRGVTNNLLGDKTWNQFVSYKIQDTQVCARFLQLKGYFPADMSMSLGSLANHFNIKLTDGTEHESKYDTQLTIEVYKRLLSI
jgi:DNA polymerase III alpha subunit (gram-positive type)